MSDTRFVAVPGAWTVSLKRRGSGRLVNVTVAAELLVAACLRAAGVVAEHYPGPGYREYGVSSAREMHTRHEFYSLARGHVVEWRRDLWTGDLNGKVV